MIQLLLVAAILACSILITPSADTCYRENEYYDLCPRNCPPQTCESIGRVYKCPAIVEGSANCKPACRCNEGYYRNKIGECISKENCLKCQGDHEYYSCGGACDNVCANIQDENQTNCLTENIKCNEMCYCESDYARDGNNVCIPIDQCPTPCRKNEVYSICIDTCSPQNCSQLGFPISCPESDVCKQGFICKDGYLRNDNGNCIPIAECPSCGGDENAKPGCGNCPTRCQDLDSTELILCTDICNPNACDCKDGYVLNMNTGKCILPEDCPCRKDPNSKPGCAFNCNKRCSNVGKPPVKCPRIACPPNGCECKDGFYFKNDTKSCVRPEDCGRESTPAPPTTVNKTEALERFNKGIIALSGQFLYQLLTGNTNSNFATSVPSLSIALALITKYATGKNLDQLLQVLNFRNKDEITSVFPSFLENYENQTDITLKIATKYYADSKYPLSGDFIQFSLNFFNASGENINFSQNVQAANTINSWVEQQTNNRIKNLVSPNMLSPDTRLALINAVYFFGNWVRQFNPKNTKTKNFYLDDNNTIQLPIMYQENSFKYGEDTKYQVLELLYKNNNYSFLVILPKQKGRDALNSLANELRDPDVFTGIIDRMSYQKVQVSLPRMSLVNTLDIGDMLKKDNVTEMFNSASNGFQGILKNSQPVFVSAIVQKCFIEVNEVGTEAAAATAVIATLSLPLAPPPTFVFNANHPYLFYIKSKKTILFCGAFLR